MIEKEIDKAYVAGCVDCDGCIQITRRNRKEINRLQYNLDVAIANTSINLMNHLGTIMPGAGTYENNGGERKITCYMFNVTGNKALELLQDILPYLVGKRKQAELGVLFQTTKGGKQGIKIDDETLEWLEFMHKQMRLLKESEPKGGVPSF